VSECVLLGLALALGWLTGINPLASLRLDGCAALAGVAATLPLLAALRWCVTTEWPPIRRLVATVVEYLSPFLAGISPAGILALSAMAGVAEEALFRGLIQAGAARHLPEWMALLVAAALFGAAHWLTPGYALLAGLIGLYLGALFLLTDNLLVPVVTHALYDVVALAVLVRMTRG
jgi:uncharacterized protein